MILLYVMMNLTRVLMMMNIPQIFTCRGPLWIMLVTVLVHAYLIFASPRDSVLLTDGFSMIYTDNLPMLKATVCL